MSVARPWTSFRLRRRLRAARSRPAPQGAPEPRLPEFARKANDLETLKKAVDDAASVSGGLWFSYLFLLTYLAIAAGAVTHADLFFEKPISLLLVNVTVPIVAFFALAPQLFLALHGYTLVSLVMLTEKTKRFHRALYQQIGETPGMSADERRKRKDARDGLRGQLPSNVFVQFLAGPPELRAGWFGWGLRVIGWITLVIGPALLLLWFQVQFLPYHSAPITWTHRVALFVDFLLVWWLWWWRILNGREPDGQRPASPWAWSVAVVLFSFTVATYRGEAIGTWLASRDHTNAIASVHDAIFHYEVYRRTRRLLSDTLVLPGVDALAELKIDDPERAKWKDYIFIAQYRDLVGADFEEAILPTIDFNGAILTGADFNYAQMDRASFLIARLEGALLVGADLRGASLVWAQLQGASLVDAKLQGASLGLAQLQGALLNYAQLQGASLKVQGASPGGAQLEGASLFDAKLQGASLDDAQLQGAMLGGAQLQGASLNGANLDAADLSDARLWRSSGTGSETRNLNLRDTADVWGPFLASQNGTQGPWNEAAYDELRTEIAALPAGRLREDALARIRTLDCADTTRVSCDPVQARTPPLEFAAWRDQLIAAKVDKGAFRRALANSLRELVCSGGRETPYVVRGAGFLDRLRAAGAEAKALLDDLRDKSGKGCPVAAELTDDDRAELTQIAADATAP